MSFILCGATQRKGAGSEHIKYAIINNVKKNKQIHQYIFPKKKKNH